MGGRHAINVSLDCSVVYNTVSFLLANLAIQSKSMIFQHCGLVQPKIQHLAKRAIRLRWAALERGFSMLFLLQPYTLNLENCHQNRVNVGLYKAFS